MCGSLEQASEKRSALMGSPASQVVSGQLVCLLGNIVHQFFTSIYSDGSRDGINWALNEDKFSFLVMCSSHSKAVAFGEQIVLQTKCPSKLVWWVDANSLICQLRSDSFFDQMIIMLDGWLLHLRSEGKHCVREESHPSYSTPSVLGRRSSAYWTTGLNNYAQIWGIDDWLCTTADQNFPHLPRAVHQGVDHQGGF